MAINRNPDSDLPRAIVDNSSEGHSSLVSTWLGGNRLAAFNAIAFGAGKELVAGVQGSVWSPGKLLANNSYEDAKFLINESNRGLGDTARTVSDRLGGNSTAAFWGIASGAGRGYSDGLRAVIWGGLVSNSFAGALNWLTSQLGYTTALRVVNDRSPTGFLRKYTLTVSERFRPR